MMLLFGPRRATSFLRLEQRSHTEPDMSQSHTRFSPRRRQLLHAAGAAALTMSPMAKAALAVGSSSRPLRLGVVLPESFRYPELPLELLAGFEAFVAASGERRVRLLPIAGGRGANTAFAAAADKVTSGAVDMLAGFVNRNLASRITPLLEERGAPFVVCDMGADIVRERHDSAYLVRNSLGYWQASFAMGQWASANLGRRAVIASDFLESGYDMVYAFRRAFEAGGGDVASVQVTGLPDGSAPLSSLAGAIRSQRPDFVYAFYSGRRAEAFLRFYESEGLSRIAPLAGAGLLTDSATLSNVPAGLEGVTTASTWAPDLDSPESSALRSAYGKVRGGEASLFAMLGFETAQRISTAMAAAGGSFGDPARLAGALAAASFTGPRGAVGPQDGLLETSAPAYVRRLSRTRSGLVNVTLTMLPAVNVPAETARELRTMAKTGWAQAYLAA